MKLKLLPVLVALCLSATASQAEPVKSQSNAELMKNAEEQKAKANDNDSGVKTLHEQSTPPKPATAVQPVMPTARQGSWRFGLWRNDHGGRYHQGMDFSGLGTNAEIKGDKVLFSDSGYITDTRNSHKKLMFKRGNGDQIVMLHARRKTSKGINDTVEAGEYALIMGRTGKAGTNVYPKHLHYEYYVPSTSGRQRFIGLGGVIGYTTRSGGRNVTFHKDSIGLQGSYATSGYVVTDPTPYLKNDVVYNGTDYDARLEQYIGNSARGQYNALYQPTIPLPLGAGAKAPKKKFANLPTGFDNMSPEEIAAMSTGAVNASLYADTAGYGVDGQLLSQRVLASFISASNGSDWSSLPQPPATVLSEMTPQEVIKKIKFQRFGNSAWEEAMVRMSSKGLLTEYLIMNTEENFLRQQNQRLLNRVELQLASLNQARLFEYNKKIEAMNIMVQADAVPNIIDRELDALAGGYYSDGSSYNDVDIGNLPSDFDGIMESLLAVIAHGEGPSHDAYNNGTACGLSESYGKGNGKFKPTQMTPTQIIRQYYPSWSVGKSVPTSKAVPCSSRLFATGAYQTIASTLASAINKHPQYANQPYTAEVQKIIAKDALLLNTYRTNLKEFLRNGGSDAKMRLAMLDLAMEWASIGTPSGFAKNNKSVASGNYQSFYGSGNKANVKSTDMAWAVLKHIQAYHNGTLASENTSPSEGGSTETGTGTATPSTDTKKGGGNTKNPADTGGK